MTHEIEHEDGEDDLFELYHSSGNARDAPSSNRPPAEPPPVGSNSGIDLDDMEVHDLLVTGRKLLLQRLLQAVHGGYASPQEMAILAKMLKDNGMVMGDPMAGPEGSSGGPQRQPLPTFTRPDYEP